jgi:hypothetical protein
MPDLGDGSRRPLPPALQIVPPLLTRLVFLRYFGHKQVPVTARSPSAGSMD